ncbi:MAG: hypothetical protein AABY88_12385 [Pseudomonadota bacterium]
MAGTLGQTVQHSAKPGVLLDLIHAEGCGGHSYLTSADLVSGKFVTRNLADVVHFLCALHGRHPGVVDLAAVRSAHDGARSWLIEAVDGFAVERLVLTKLTVAAGPMPSTPGQAESESAVGGQRHALDMLARSDRDGCSLGAALALVMDWWAVRAVLDRAAKRWSVEIPACSLPSLQACQNVATRIANAPAIERAMVFGAQQILNQHRGLVDLLEARHMARGEY